MVVMVQQRIQSLDRGLKILEYIADQDHPVRLVEMAKLLGIEKSSVHRLVRTLAERGYVWQDEKTLGYVLHEKVFVLAGKLASRRRVHEFARKYLCELAHQTGETAHLAVRGGQGAIFVDHEYGSHPVAVTTQWGSSEPLHCTALGKALLAGMELAELKSLLPAATLKRYTPNTITRISELAEQCREVKQQQVAYDYAEFRDGMNCAASPVYDFRGQVVAAIGISGPAERVNRATIKEMARLVRDSARRLSLELGYSYDHSTTAAKQ